MTVVDEISCAGEHDVEMFWHFAEHCAVRRAGDSVVARCGPVELSMILPADMQYEVFQGSEDPLLGWVSRTIRRALARARTVRAAARIRGDTRLVTTMTASFEAADCDSGAL